MIITEALGEERARELRARGADMDWDQAVAYTLDQTTEALNGTRSSAHEGAHDDEISGVTQVTNSEASTPATNGFTPPGSQNTPRNR